MSPKPQSVTCEYCATLNLAGGHRCIACGAPLPVVKVLPLTVSEVETPIPAPEFSPIPEVNQPLSQQLKEGAAVVGTGLGVLGIGGLILRTVAEASRDCRGSFYHRDERGHRGYHNARNRNLLTYCPGRRGLVGIVRGAGDQAHHFHPSFRPCRSSSGQPDRTAVPV